MPIRLDELNAAAGREYTPLAKSLTEAINVGYTTAFLCHSHLDARLAKGFAAMLSEAGWTAYIDWMDHTMPDKPNRETARKLQQRIMDSTYFLFLATPNSMSSRWCPWELGYADGKKQLDRIIVVRTTDNARTYGNEYLELYRNLDFTELNHRLAVWRPGEQQGVLVEHLGVR